MRARSLKPSLFKNEVLGAADPLLTILFEGLWCEADREGRLEDRPLRIKAEVFPYRESIDIESMLSWLEQHDFIKRFKAKGISVIQVTKFLEHQRPHTNEVASVLPSMDDIEHNQGKKRAQPRSKALRSDSGLLTPDSLYLTPDSTNTHVARADTKADFDGCKTEYPKRGGGQRWGDAERGYERSRANGATHADVLAGVKRYAAFIRETGKEGSEYVQQAGTFFGRNEGWKEPWNIPLMKRELSPVEKVMAANGVRQSDERVVSEQFGGSDSSLGNIFGDVRGPPHSGLRRIGS